MIRYRAQGKPFIWIAASTHDGEELAAMQAHKQLLAQQPQALLIVVPRHPERFNSVARAGRVFGAGVRAAQSAFAGRQLRACIDTSFAGGYAGRFVNVLWRGR